MKKLSLGVLNFMPNATEYMETIRAALAAESHLIDLLPIRLKSHEYRSSKQEVASYPVFDELMQRGPLDMLLVTGAPVEHLPYEDIQYFEELNDIFAHAQQRISSIMGLCFGGLALAKYLGIDKRVVKDKIFGVHQVKASHCAQRYVGHGRTEFNLPLSTWALLDESQLAHSRLGPLRSLAHHPELGPLMLATPNEQFVIMLGHPEYTVDTLYREWQRDLGKNSPYTRRFTHRSFVEMERQLQQGASPILANWVRNHHAKSTLAA